GMGAVHGSRETSCSPSETLPTPRTRLRSVSPNSRKPLQPTCIRLPVPTRRPWRCLSHLFGTLCARPGFPVPLGLDHSEVLRQCWTERAEEIPRTHIRTRSIQNCGRVRPDHLFISPTELPRRVYTK